MKRLLAVDLPVLAKTEIEESDGKIFIHNTQDAEPIVEDNKILLSSGEDGYTASRSMRRVASLPTLLWLDLKKKGIVDDPKRLAAWLNDPDNRFFRTAPGRI
jgi:hypothetical protein